MKHMVNGARRAVDGVGLFPILLAVVGAACTVHGSPAFDTPRTEYGVANQPRGLEIGDLNGDDRPDIVVASATAGTNVTVLLNLGGGKFDQAIGIETEGIPYDVTIADFNHDGKPDLATAIYGTAAPRGIAILLNQGDAAFVVHTNYFVGAATVYPIDVATGDFNEDGHADIVYADWNHNWCRIQLGNGDGSFQSPYAVSSLAGEVKTHNVAVCDLDEDGNQDLVMRGQTTVYTQYGDGAGGFGVASNWSLNGSPVQTKVADLDGDDNLDLVTVNTTGVDVHWGNGTRAFPAASNYPFGASGLASLTFADVDSDDDLDLVVASSYNVVIVKTNQGERVFAAATTTNQSGQIIYSMDAGDLDGDGRTDVVASCFGTDGVAVHLGSESGFLGDHPRIATQSNPRGVELADFNGDQKPDMAVVNRSGAAGKRLSIYINDGTGSFLNPVEYGSVSIYPEHITAGDFNEDGDLDLAVTHGNPPTLGIFLNNGDGTFGAEMSYGGSGGTVSSETFDIETGDFNNDNHLDIAMTDPLDGIAVFLGGGDGTFGAGVAVAMGTTPNGVAVGDFNADGDDDLAAGAVGGGYELWVRLGNGDGTFGTAAWYPLPTVNLTNGRDVDAGDFNADGKLDLAVTACRTVNNPDSSLVCILLGNGDGTFAPRVDYVVGRVSQQLEIADVDADGNLDVATSDRSGASLSLLLGNGDGSFRRDGFSYGSRNGADCRDLALGDIDGNGKADAVLTSYGANCVEVFYDWPAPQPSSLAGTVIIIR